MDSAVEYLDAAKARHGIKSDRQLASALGQSAQWPHQVRSGKTLPSDESMVRLAELAGVDPARALLELNLWKARDLRVTEHYSKLLQRLVGVFALFALLIGGSNTVLASTIKEQSDANSLTTIYYQKLRIYLLLAKAYARRFNPIYLLSA